MTSSHLRSAPLTLLPHVPADKAASALEKLEKGALSLRTAVQLGFASVDEVDDWVEYWHGNQTNCSLNEFLGLDRQEYAHWMRDVGSLVEMFNNASEHA